MVEIKKPVIEAGWYEALRQEFESPYFAGIKTFLIEEKRQYVVYPPSPLIFNAFNRTPFDKVKVVILGQDPYHGVGHTGGLALGETSTRSSPASFAICSALLVSMMTASPFSFTSRIGEIWMSSFVRVPSLGRLGMRRSRGLGNKYDLCMIC